MQWPTFGAMVENTEKSREDFFKLIFPPGSKGYLCIAYISPLKRGDAEQHFFNIETELPKALQHISNNTRSGKHAYFCPHLFKTKERKKEQVESCPTAWADLDTCDPALLNVGPSVVIQSSPGRFQALWLFDRPIAPLDAEDISRRIAYFHKEQGCDMGWHLTKLLRIPYTLNYKYGDTESAPLVVITSAHHRLMRKSDFNSYPEIQATRFVHDDMPEMDQEPPLDIMQRYRTTLNPLAFELFDKDPTEDEDWSSRLWKLIQILIESGMSRQQQFAVAMQARCNKYARDGRPPVDLWNEVLRANVKHLEITLSIPKPDTVIYELMTDEEVEKVQQRETFVERYIKWATDLTDAAPQYHQAGGFTALSAVISSNARLFTSFGTVRPNLWFMILADTTLTRKTTAMRIATSLLQEIDDDVVFATDGSAEGILSSLSDRDGKASLFYRDEVTGLMQSIMAKDYMSDMPEHFTKLYDNDVVRRLLKKETITVRDPVFLMLCGGIKSKIQLMLTEEHIASGFVPRFVFITAEADVSRLRPVGPAVNTNDETRSVIVNELTDIRNHYNSTINMHYGNSTIGAVPNFSVELTNDAWIRYNELENVMVKSALDSGLSFLTPVYDRLSKSILKAAILIAASRQRGSTIHVDKTDILHAIYYGRHWKTYGSEIVNGVGKSKEERLIDAIVTRLKTVPGGIARSELMRDYQLTNKRAAELFATMLQRNLIHKTQFGASELYHAVREV